MSSLPLWCHLPGSSQSRVTLSMYLALISFCDTLLPALRYSNRKYTEILLFFFLPYKATGCSPSQCPQSQVICAARTKCTLAYHMNFPRSLCRPCQTGRRPWQSATGRVCEPGTAGCHSQGSQSHSSLWKRGTRQLCASTEMRAGQQGLALLLISAPLKPGHPWILQMTHYWSCPSNKMAG